jgi:hypothetical protein
MSPGNTQQASAVGHDSFLDVVTNMVGILIVLVMVVGMRIKNAPVQLVPDRQTLQARASLEKHQAAERTLQQEVMDTAREIQTAAEQAVRRGAERDLLATLVAAAEQKILAARDQLHEGGKEDFDAARELADARRKLERLQQAQQSASQRASEPEIVQSYPTPLARTVVGHEAHFQLRGGRVAHIPLENLLLAARSDAQAKADKLFGQQRLPEFTATVGPDGGFRLKYTAVREDKTERTPSGLARVAYLRIVQWTAVPVSGELGEPVEAALSGGSQFRQVLSGLRPGETTVTVWTYEDSFDALRRLRAELYRLGFPIAVRPLPDGVMIGGSPRGSKSETE